MTHTRPSLHPPIAHLLACAALTTLAALSAHAAPAQAQARPDASERGDDDAPRFFVSTSAFMVMNVILETPPDFYQLNAGWRWDRDNALVLEAITWRYFNPLGIPSWDEGYERPSTAFPGFIRDAGVGVAWQHFWWRGLYTILHTTPFMSRYYNDDGEHITTGFKLFVAARVGYRFEFLDDVLFVEPSVVCTAWPIQTNMPDDFRREDAKWPGYFLFEPGLNVGLSF